MNKIVGYIASPGGGGEGVPHSISLPPGLNGPGTGTWSGNVITDGEPFTNKVEEVNIREITTEDLMNKIRALIRVNTPESIELARSLKQELDDRMRRLKAARRQYQMVKVADDVALKQELKKDPYVQALFQEHNLDLNRLDEVQILDTNATEHCALHDLVHKILEGQTAQPIKGECPESGEEVYMSQADLVENDYKADCPEGERELENTKSVSIKEYTKHKNKKKKIKNAVSLQPFTLTPEEQAIVDKVKEAADTLDIDTYLVGGFIRDRISGKDDKEAAGDLDFMCEHDVEKIVSYLMKKYGAPEPIRYGRSQAILLTIDSQPIDFIDAKQVFRPLISKDVTLEEEDDETVAFDDAYRRDFTINTLMYDIRKEKLFDPTGRGLKDLQAGILNTIIDPFIKFRIHAPDMLRALRFAATLGFQLGPKMIEAMKANAERVKPRDQGGDISNRRIRKELRKAIDRPEHWAKMRELMQQTGLDLILAEDVQDVQEDFEGSINYHFDEEQKGEKAMNIKGFCKQSGIFDKWFGKQPPDRPPTREEKVQYLAKKLDEILIKTPESRRAAVTTEFLNQYATLTKADRVMVMSLSKYYGQSTGSKGLSNPADHRWIH
jgi:hypothetical protein